MQSGHRDPGEEKQVSVATAKELRLIYNFKEVKGKDMENPSNFPGAKVDK